MRGPLRRPAPPDRYLEAFDRIRALQDYLIERADRPGIPIIDELRHRAGPESGSRGRARRRRERHGARRNRASVRLQARRSYEVLHRHRIGRGGRGDRRLGDPLRRDHQSLAARQGGGRSGRHHPPHLRSGRRPGERRGRFGRRRRRWSRRAARSRRSTSTWSSRCRSRARACARRGRSRTSGIRVNMTLVFSANQALLTAQAGATYASCFMGRLDDISIDSAAVGGRDRRGAAAGRHDHPGAGRLDPPSRARRHRRAARLRGRDRARRRSSGRCSSHPLTEKGTRAIQGGLAVATGVRRAGFVSWFRSSQRKPRESAAERGAAAYRRGQAGRGRSRGRRPRAAEPSRDRGGARVRARLAAWRRERPTRLLLARSPGRRLGARRGRGRRGGGRGASGENAVTPGWWPVS